MLFTIVESNHDEQRWKGNSLLNRDAIGSQSGHARQKLSVTHKSSRKPLNETVTISTALLNYKFSFPKPSGPPRTSPPTKSVFISRAL